VPTLSLSYAGKRGIGRNLSQVRWGRIAKTCETAQVAEAARAVGDL